MTAVADSSPLILLSKLHYFELLPEIFPKVFIPQEVHHEVVIQGAGLPGASEVASASWIETRAVTKATALSGTLGLGPGESSAIKLALGLSAEVVLLDDYRARSVAKAEGLRVAGTVGLLKAFYRRRLIVDLRAAFMGLVTNAAYVDQRLLNRRLQLLGFPEL